MERAVELVASRLSSQLDAQTPRVVGIARAIMIALFAGIQLVVFGIAGIAAYRDLKVIT